MSGLAAPKSADSGTGRSLKVGIVACGRQSAGFRINLKKLREAETFIERKERVELMNTECLGDDLLPILRVFLKVHSGTARWGI